MQNPSGTRDALYSPEHDPDASLALTYLLESLAFQGRTLERLRTETSLRIARIRRELERRSR